MSETTWHITSDTAWVVGNGPSLRDVPLNLLQGRPSFGVQRIHLIYPDTHWRPTHFVMADRSRPTQPQQWLDDLGRHIGTGEFVYVRSDMVPQILAHYGLDELPDGFKAWMVCEHINGDDRIDSPIKPRSWHEGICKYGGSVPVAIQIAAYMGVQRIRLIGCDLGYKDAGNVNHFHPKYNPVDSLTVDQARIENQTIEDAHQIARRECEARGIDIKNAWPKSGLGVYEKIDFFSALNE